MLRGDELRVWQPPSVQAQVSALIVGIRAGHGKKFRVADQALAPKTTRSSNAKPPRKRVPRVLRKRAPRALPTGERLDPLMLDDFEGEEILWKLASWGSPGKLSIVDREGSARLALAYTRTHVDKCVIQRKIGRECEFGKRRRLVLDAYNESAYGLQLTVGFFIGDGKGFYESIGKHVRKGTNRDISFDLMSQRFKCAKSGWANASPLEDRDQVTAMVIFVYPRGPGVVTFDNIRLE